MNKELDRKNSARVLDAMGYIDGKFILDAMEADCRQNAQDGVNNAQRSARKAPLGRRLRTLVPLSAVAAALVAAILILPMIFRGFGVSDPPQSPGPGDPFPGSVAGTDSEPNEPQSPQGTQTQESTDEPDWFEPSGETETGEPETELIDQTEVTT